MFDDPVPVAEAVIRTLSPGEARAAVPALAGLLVDAVAAGASVNFLAGFTHGEGEAFWIGQLPLVETGGRRILVAEAGGVIAGCVVLTPAPQPNAPFRGDVGKMLVHSAWRRRGLGRRLLEAAETAALDAGLTLLMLDTETGSAGHALYGACGWTEFGTVPGHSFRPDGVPAPTTFFYKQLVTR